MPNQSQFEELSEAEKLRLLRKKLREQFKREQREFFEQFCKNPELFPDKAPAKHHQFMIGALQGVANGEIKRLMVLMPPGHGKSVYCSIRFPAWYLGNNPRNHLVHATYGGELAGLNGRKTRNLIDSDEYAAVFPNVSIAEDFKGRADWATNHGGQYFAVGVGGGVTGRRAHGALLDDLVKDRQEADSLTKRETVWDWYKTALRTRLRKNGWIIFVNTRWHEDDPAGRILPENWSGESGWVTARVQAIEQKFDATVERIAHELCSIAFADPAELFDQDGRLRQVKDLPPISQPLV